MTIQDKISEHFQKSVNGDLQKYHCEEWGSDIYYRNTYAFKDESKIVELAAKGMEWL